MAVSGLLWEWGLPQGLLTGLVGDSGSGKSSVALAVAKPIIIPGERFPNGSECRQNGPILYADTESAQGVLGIRRLTQHVELGLDADPVVSGHDGLTERVGVVDGEKGQN